VLRKPQNSQTCLTIFNWSSLHKTRFDDDDDEDDDCNGSNICTTAADTTTANTSKPHDMSMQAHMGGGAITLTHLQPVTTRKWVVSTTLRPLYPWERPGIHCKGGWVSFGVRLDGTENLAPTGIRSPGRPVLILMPIMIIIIVVTQRIRSNIKMIRIFV
jgi:hypothetical protein